MHEALLAEYYSIALAEFQLTSRMHEVENFNEEPSRAKRPSILCNNMAFHSDHQRTLAMVSTALSR